MADQFPFFYDQDLDEDTNKKVNMEIMKYSGLYILKKLDLPPEEGGHLFEVPLSGLDEHMEPILDDLFFHNLIDIDTDNARYALTQEGSEYIDKIVAEVEGYIDKYQEFDPATKVNLMRRDKVNPLRARFLWGLYDGEFDDFNEWQENWDIDPTQRKDDWREVITSKDFYDMLFENINNMEAFDDDALDQVLKEAEEERAKEQANLPAIEITRVEGQSGGNGRQDEEVIVETDYYYNDPYYFNPVYDPFFWYVVF
ncbi:MAG: hypothetical protein IEMM0008_1877 [bacterium]|nr:MAG: hypothetical protein IEMM0008_1877 [bacterium]